MQIYAKRKIFELPSANKVLLRAQKFLWLKKTQLQFNSSLKILCASRVWLLQLSVSRLKGCLFQGTGMALLLSLRFSVLCPWQGPGGDAERSRQPRRD